MLDFNLTFDEIKGIIDKVNQLILDMNQDEDTVYCEAHYYNGDFYIYFLEQEVWNSDEDDRKYDYENDCFIESVHDYVFNQINEILKSVNKINFNICSHCNKMESLCDETSFGCTL